jgi:hypothetical protein
MTVRTPLYLNGGNLQEMTTTQIDEIKSQVRYLYATDPSVDLSVVSSGGSLGIISDTRKTAGASITRVDRYAIEEETDEPGTVTVEYSRIDQSAEDTTETADTSNIAFPVYNNGGNIQAMTLTDMYDTFIYSEIDTIADGNDRPGTYRIHTANSLSGQTLISATPVFSDTRANTALYAKEDIAEELDQPFTVNNYYLFRVNAGNAVSYTSPVFIRSDNNLQEYSTASFDAILKYVPGDYDEYGRCTMRDYLEIAYIDLKFNQTFEQRERQSRLDELLQKDMEDLFNF